MIRIWRACRAFYVHLRDWIIATELDWTDSGRVFEHMWPQVTSALLTHKCSRAAFQGAMAMPACP